MPGTDHLEVAAIYRQKAAYLQALSEGDQDSIHETDVCVSVSAQQISGAQAK